MADTLAAIRRRDRDSPGLRQPANTLDVGLSYFAFERPANPKAGNSAPFSYARPMADRRVLLRGVGEQRLWCSA
jgi:hypothetical protein